MSWPHGRHGDVLALVDSGKCAFKEPNFEPVGRRLPLPRSVRARVDGTPSLPVVDAGRSSARERRPAQLTTAPCPRRRASSARAWGELRGQGNRGRHSRPRHPPDALACPRGRSPSHQRHLAHGRTLSGFGRFHPDNLEWIPRRSVRTLFSETAMRSGASAVGTLRPRRVPGRRTRQQGSRRRAGVESTPSVKRVSPPAWRAASIASPSPTGRRAPLS
jgi:hypothetical protein